MKIKMIALDLDRTTLNRNGRLSDENRKVLTELLNRGIHVIPASGRSLTSFPQEILTLPGLKYVITSNGAAVYRLPEQENRKSGENPERYRHCICGGFTRGESRSLGEILRRLCAS